MTRAVAAVLVLGALVGYAAAAPPGPPPKVSGASDAPPPAWVEVGKTKRWLAYSSYCWKTTCVDFIPPAMRNDIPVVTIRRGQPVTIHLGFRPYELSVGQGTKTKRLVPARTATWRPVAGLTTIFARPDAGGDASYLLRIRLR